MTRPLRRARRAEAPIRIAYRDGPPEIQFAGRAWRIGVPQAVTTDELSTMQGRRDFSACGFSRVN